jgi:hypothetical protein
MMIFALLLSNTPVYVEDFHSHEPDWANHFALEGDPPLAVEATPAFKRAMVHALPDEPNYHKTEEVEIIIGRDQDTYDLTETIHVVGAYLRGLHRGVTLKFTSAAASGLHVHYPQTNPGPGTSYALDGPWKGYGGTAKIENLILQGSNAEGSRALIMQRTVRIRDVEAFDWGWHCFHLTADVTRTEASIDGAISNANMSELIRVRGVRCGSKPGFDPKRVSAANPLGRRPWGSALRIEGGDANVVYTRMANGSNCAGWAIDDVGFLGNTHVIPHSVLNFHGVQQWEHDIANHPQATTAEKRDFATFGKAVGQTLHLAYRVQNSNARSLVLDPYVEGSQPIVHVPSPATVVGGPGGADTPETLRLRAGQLDGTWRNIKKPTEPGLTATDEVWLGEGNGTMLTFFPRGDGGQPYRMRYKRFENDDPTKKTAAAGFYRWDHANANSRISYYFTGDKSYEQSDPSKQKLDPGRMILPDHYRGYWGKARKVIAGTHGSPALAGLNAANFRPGDRYEPIEATEGFIGWVVQTSSVGNVWRPYGRIE